MGGATARAGATSGFLARRVFRLAGGRGAGVGHAFSTEPFARGANLGVAIGFAAAPRDGGSTSSPKGERHFDFLEAPRLRPRRSGKLADSLGMRDIPLIVAGNYYSFKFYQQADPS